MESTLNPAKWAHHRVGLLSPLLANILLPQFDQELERRGHRFARYAEPVHKHSLRTVCDWRRDRPEAWRALQGDDMVTLVKSERAAQRVMDSITRYLETTLKLKVNLVKSKVAPMSECAFQSLSFGNASLSITLRIAATALPSKGASALSIASGG